MSATAAEGHSLAEVRNCVTRILLDLASVTASAVGAAAQERLKRAALMAARAETRDELEAAIVYAGGEL